MTRVELGNQFCLGSTLYGGIHALVTTYSVSMSWVLKNWLTFFEPYDEISKTMRFVPQWCGTNETAYEWV